MALKASREWSGDRERLNPYGLAAVFRLSRQRPQQQVNKGEKMKSTTYVEEIELNAEEMEEVIAPALSVNHNETVEVDLSAEEMEEVIAPLAGYNNNETLISDAQ